MKMFKNVLVVIAMLTIGSALAKRTGATSSTVKPVVTPVTTPSTPVAPTLPARTGSFQSSMLAIRVMKPEQVINKNGEFTKKFEEFVMSTNLSPIFQKSLLEAGANLHMPLSNDNNENEQLIEKVNTTIESILNSPRAVVATTEIDFYDPNTNLFTEEYLQVQVKNLSRDLNLEQKQRALTNRLLPQIQDRWDSEGGLFTNAYKKDLAKKAKEQIVNAIIDSGVAGVAKEFYDYWTDEINTDYLRKEVGSGKPLAQLKQEIMPKMSQVWNEKQLGDLPQRAKTLATQIEEAHAARHSKALPQPKAKPASQPTKSIAQLSGMLVSTTIGKLTSTEKDMLKLWLSNHNDNTDAVVGKLIQALKKMYTNRDPLIAEGATTIVDTIISINDDKEGSLGRDANIKHMEELLLKNEFGQMPMPA